MENWSTAFWLKTHHFHTKIPHQKPNVLNNVPCAFIFLRALRALIFLRPLRAFIFWRALRALRAFIFLHALLAFNFLKCFQVLTCLYFFIQNVEQPIINCNKLPE